jgi:hypothetical protein
VARHVEEEEVLPRLRLDGARLDLGQVHVVLRERLQHQVERPDLVPAGEEDRGLVVPRGDGRLLPEDDEPGEVVRVVLDPLPDRRKAVDLARRLPGDRRRRRIVRRELRRARRALDVEDGDLAKVPLEPAAALGDGVRMGVDLPHVVDVARDVQEVVRHLDEDLPADQQVVIDEHVEGVADDPLAAVLDRHHPEVGRVPVDRVEHPGEVDLGNVLGALAEMLQAREVGEGGLGAQERHGERLFEGEGRGDDLPVDRLQPVVGERPFVRGGQAPEDLHLPLGDVELEVALRLDRPDLDGRLRPAVQQLEDPVVDGVDFDAELLQAVLRQAAPPAFRFIAPISRNFR